ncbi:hypothetical protein CGZ80_13700 [Rhodopirellula sp. MGV]|nr:hypothetical protein CGZ80_13700 [Rhodopirellula sp. MGV]
MQSRNSPSSSQLQGPLNEMLSQTGRPGAAAKMPTQSQFGNPEYKENHRMVGDNEDWKSFEIAVTQFVAAIAPDATVTHDVKVPDAHTGYPRQRDVWIQWSIGGHFPAKAMISCKFWSKKLDEQDIDHFNGEFISSKAHVGILYSREGFNPRAIEKANALGFHCCKLYSNAPADLPDQIVLGLAYHFAPRFKLSLDQDLPSSQFRTWDDVFDLRIEGQPIREILADILDQYQGCKNLNERWGQARIGRGFTIDLAKCLNTRNRLGIVISDRVRRARVEYTLLNGSYNFTSKLFMGSQATPWIDTQSIDPGPGWEDVRELPEQIPQPMIACFMHCNSASAVTEFGAQVLARN